MPDPADFDESSAVFPPSRHEGLAVRADPPSSVSPPAAAAAGPVPSKPEASWALVKVEFWRRMRLGFEILRSKFLLMPLLDRARVAGRRVVWWCFAFVSMAIWIHFRRRRRPVARGSDSLLLLAQEKDRKISQLLHQVAEMNEKISQLVHQIAEANEVISANCKVQVLKRA